MVTYIKSLNKNPVFFSRSLRNNSPTGSGSLSFTCTDGVLQPSSISCTTDFQKAGSWKIAQNGSLLNAELRDRCGCGFAARAGFTGV